MDAWVNDGVSKYLGTQPFVCALYVFRDLQFQAQKTYSNRHKHSLNWINLWVLTSSVLLFFFVKEN